MLDFTQLGGD